MDIKLDEATGLPALPEEYFWRVVDRRGTRGYHHNQLEVHLVQKVIITEEVAEWVSVGRPWTNLWFEKFEPATKTVESFKEVVVLSDDLMIYTHIEPEARERFTDAGWKQVSSNPNRLYLEDEDDEFYGKLKMVKLIEPTQENILDLSKKIFEKFVILQNEKVAEDLDAAARAKVVGDYPPKSLNSDNIDGGIKASNVEKGES